MDRFCSTSSSPRNTPNSRSDFHIGKCAHGGINVIKAAQKM